MAGCSDHSELDAWQLSRELEEQLAVVLARPAFRRHARLLDQLARSSEGPPVHIAEGFSRFYPRENAPFVRIARASISETIIHLHKSYAKGLINAAELQALTRLAKRARGAATGYLLYLESDEARVAAKRHSGQRRQLSALSRTDERNPGTKEPNPRTEEPELPNLRTPERKNDQCSSK